MEFLQVTVQMLQGAVNTIGLFFATLIIALPLGMLVALCAMSKFKLISKITNILIWIIRGTPLMLQIIIVFYVPGLLFGSPMKVRFLAALIAFSINYAAYFAEIFRGGINSISKGQYEAGFVLGMSKAQIFFKIIIPQVVKKIMPPMSNEIISLVKDTSLANVIAISEIILVAKDIVATKGIIWPLFYTGVFYLIFSGLLTLLFKFIEKKLNYYKG